MPEIVADLHLHSTYSDGLNSPEELAQLVVAKGLKAFSITDHDTVKGIEQAKTDKATLIPGIELTSTLDGKEVHVLGYYLNPGYAPLLETLNSIAVRREKRLMDIVDKLNAGGKVRLDKDELTESLEKRSYNRLNLARFMVKKGLTPNVERAFNLYIGDGAAAYEAVNFFSPALAIRLIHKAGGIAFLAHPYSNNTSALIPELVECGLNGIEAFHPSHNAASVEKCLDWAKRFKIGICGGSDYHGNSNSARKILAAGLTGERLVEFMALNPLRDFVAA